jgi:hypothetical protein
LSLYSAQPSDKAHLFCAECIQRLEDGERLYLVFTSEYEPPGPPEEGFWWLFKAARALIKKGVIQEDQILPTLVFWHEIDRGAAGGAPAGSFDGGLPSSQAWETVERVDDIDILEEVPIRADFLLKVGPTGNKAEGVPHRVLIQVSFHKKAVEPKRVGAIYAEKLAAKGISFGSVSSGSIDYVFERNRLFLTVGLKKGPTVDGRAFPPPRLVEAFYSELLGDPGQRLTTRGKQFVVNKQLGASNLIPASVAFLLRASGGLQGRKEIHRLLNDQVFGEKKFDESGYASTSDVVQLWRDVPKAGTRIARMLPIFWGRPISEHFLDD